MRTTHLFLLALALISSPAALLAQEDTHDTSIDTASWAEDEAAKEAVADKADCSCDCSCDCYDPCCGRYLYVSGIAGVSMMNGQSGGFNEEGPHPNTGSDDNDVFTYGGAIGVAIPREYGLLRLEFEARGRNEFHGVTDSFQPPVPTFFYDVAMRDVWSTMFNAWYDVQVRDKWAVYGGGGVGVGGFELQVNDTVVAGRGDTADFNWQLGFGVIYEINDRVELDFGYRYVNMGNGNVQLSEIGTGNDDGNYRLAPTASDLLLQVRINDPFTMLRQ
jgi:opacity protein-like surface antigen